MVAEFPLIFWAMEAEDLSELHHQRSSMRRWMAAVAKASAVWVR